MKIFTHVKHYFLFLVPLFILSSIDSVEASHLLGMHQKYECLNACSLEVKLSLYRDCTGTASMGNTNPVFSSTQSGCTTMPVLLGNSAFFSVTEVTPVCPGVQTQCNNPSAPINGFELYTAVSLVDICSATPNCEFRMSYSSCCRNAAITSLNNASIQSQDIYNTINTGVSPCNNSPEFTPDINGYFCEGNVIDINLGAYDADGDSLSFVLDTCRTTGGIPIAYTTGFSPQQPFGPDWTVSFDGKSGNLRATPTPGSIQVPVVCVLVQEWRNGVLIGQSTRDIQLTLVPCPGNTIPQFTAYANTSPWITQTGDHFSVPIGVPFSLDITSLDPDVSQTVSLYWDSNIAGAIFADATNSATLDSITGVNPTGRFTYTAASAGIYQFRVYMKDDACPIYGFQSKVITIEASAATSPDILGQALTNLNAPLPNQRIYLIKHDTVAQSLTAVDSTFSDGQGYFSFSNIQDSILYVKAAPDSALFPNDMPTYADTAIFYTGARAMSVANVPYNFTFSTRAGGNPGGPGFVGGLISQGANKTNGPGDPVIGMRVFLLDSATNAVYGYTETDANGYFSFSNVLLTTFKIVPDQAGISTSNVPHVTLNLASYNQDSIEFLLQSTHLELKPEVVVVGLPVHPDFSWSVFPNPIAAGRSAQVLKLDLPADEALQIRLLDIRGRELWQQNETPFDKGQHIIPLPTDELAEGIYFLELKVSGRRLSKKILVGS